MAVLHQNVIEIVRLLSDGQYHDAVFLAEQLNLSTTDVEQLVRQLEKHEIPVLWGLEKGYKLDGSLILLNQKSIQSQLRHNYVPLTILEKTTSTNDYFKSLSKETGPVQACLAEAQTAGRGRLGREWHSPFAQNIYLSMLVPFEKDISDLSGLSLVIGLALCRAIDVTMMQQSKKPVVKWPNDVMIDNKKVAGTLVEIKESRPGFCQVIIGVGVNVNMHKALKEDINQAWTSLFNVTGQYIDRNIFSAQIIDTLIDYLERFSLKGLSAFSQEWETRDGLAQSQVAVVYNNRKITGTCVGINEQGYLKVKQANGHVELISSGEATLLK